MATIEERAYKTYPITKDDWDNTIEWTTMADIKEDKCEAYIQGATDQQQIDKEFFLDCYCKDCCNLERSKCLAVGGECHPYHRLSKMLNE